MSCSRQALATSIPTAIACLLLTMMLAAQTAQQVADINKTVPTNTVYDPYPGWPPAISYQEGNRFVTLGGKALFRGPQRLCSSDGAPIGNVELTYGIGRVGSRAYFAGKDSSHGAELWVTDGTDAGTHLVADLNPGGQDSSPQRFTPLGNSGRFVFHTANPQYTLWISDGTQAGTQQLRSGIAASHFVELGSKIVFRAFDSSVNDTELWVTDGTPAGTMMIKNLYPGGKSNPSYLTRIGNKIVFEATTGSGPQLWVTDGTAAGTQLLQGTIPFTNDGVNLSHRVVLGNKMYFEAFYRIPCPACTLHGWEIWVTDGTPAGTKLVVDLYPGHSSGYFREGLAVGTRIYFAGSTTSSTGAPTGVEPMMLDTATGKVTVLKDISAGSSSPQGFAALGNGQVIFSADDGVIGRELYVSDGTQAGTKLLIDHYPGTSGCDPRHMTSLPSGKVVLRAQDPLDPYRRSYLYETDGKTLKKVALPPGWTNSSDPRPLGVLTDKFLFAADDGVNGQELWISDGTTTGTRMIADIHTGKNSSGTPNSSGAWRACRLGGRILFSADDGIHGRELWTTDGTPAGTKMVADTYPGNSGTGVPNAGDPYLPIRLGSRVLFSAVGASVGRELWVSDGTSAGTKLLKDIASTGNSNPYVWGCANGKAYFTAETPATGRELWVSDGTPVGTMLLKDIHVGKDVLTGEDPSPRGFAALPDGRIVFQASDGENLFSAGHHGAELWISDGTAAGTQLLKDIDPAVFSLYNPWLGRIVYIAVGSEPDDFCAMGGRVYFFTKDHALWVTDGTSAGTTKLRDDVGYSSIFARTDRIYFTGKDNKLWESDGSALGTKTLSGVVSQVNKVLIGTRHMWGAANGSSGGYDLARTDLAAAAGTVRLRNYPSRQPGSFTVVHGKVFFVADDGKSGLELWAIDNGATATEAGEGFRPGQVEPELSATDPVMGQSTDLALSMATPNTAGMLLIGLPDSTPTRIPSGPTVFLDLALPTFPLPLMTDAQGKWSQKVAVPSDTSFQGTTLYIQLGIDAPAVPPLGLMLSSAVALTIGR